MGTLRIKPNECHTLEYGTIYNNSISNILEHTFGGRPKHREHGNTFIFDVEELVRVGKAYNLPTKIQTRLAVKKMKRGAITMEKVLKTLKALKGFMRATVVSAAFSCSKLASGCAAFWPS